MRRLLSTRARGGSRGWGVAGTSAAAGLGLGLAAMGLGLGLAWTGSVASLCCCSVKLLAGGETRSLVRVLLGAAAGEGGDTTAAGD